MEELDGRVARVTGGARGQRAAEARLFAREGATVVITDVLDEQGERTAGELGCTSTLAVAPNPPSRPAIDEVLMIEPGMTNTVAKEVGRHGPSSGSAWLAARCRSARPSSPPWSGLARRCADGRRSPPAVEHGEIGFDHVRRILGCRRRGPTFDSDDEAFSLEQTQLFEANTFRSNAENGGPSPKTSTAMM